MAICEAIEIANDTPSGMAAYLQTGDPARTERVAAQLLASAVHINVGEFNYGLPFGGYKQSGNGREGGEQGLEDYQEIKTLHFGWHLSFPNSGLGTPMLKKLCFEYSLKQGLIYLNNRMIFLAVNFFNEEIVSDKFIAETIK